MNQLYNYHLVVSPQDQSFNMSCVLEFSRVCIMTWCLYYTVFDYMEECVLHMVCI